MTDSFEFSIGKVAKLTGLSTHTIRKWEQRYRAVEPLRSPGGDRRYGRAQVERLKLLRELSAAGAAISDIAGLPTAALQRRSRHQPAAAPEPPRRLRVGVIGESLETLLSHNRLQMPQLCFAPFNAERRADQSTIDQPDVIVLERPLLNSATQQELTDLRLRTGVTSLAVVYSFATREQALALSDQETACVRTPLHYHELQRTLLALAATDAPKKTVARSEPRYSRQVLAEIAALPPSIVCECPRHIAELIVALGDFEAYSTDCENRYPGDAAMHAYLKETAATARWAFERALEAVAEHENLSLAEASDGV